MVICAVAPLFAEQPTGCPALRVKCSVPIVVGNSDICYTSFNNAEL